MGLLDRLAPRKREPDAASSAPSAAADDPVFATKALRKFLTCLTSRESPVLLDLGPVVGSNVSFFGEQLGCKIFVEDIFADLDRHVRDGQARRAAGVPRRSAFRRPTARSTASCAGTSSTISIGRRRRRSPTSSTRVLRPDGALLGFFGTAQPRDARYTKYIIVDEVNLKHRSYPAARGRQAILLEPRHHPAVPRPARVRFVPAAEQPARDPVPQARLSDELATIA